MTRTRTRTGTRTRTRTRTTNGPGDPAPPDGGRLHEAFAREIDRPGLEGPSYEAVLRSGTARLRRRRATVGATVAMASVAAVTTAVLATGGGTAHDGNAADGTAATTPAAAGTTPAAGTSAPDTSSPVTTTPTTTTSTSADTSSHPADAVVASGTLDGHRWQLVRQFKLDQGPPHGIAGRPGAPTHQVPQWCGDLNVIVDGTWTNAGGDAGCIREGQMESAPPLTEPEFASIAIVTAQHVRLGTIVTGAVNPHTASVTALCGAKPFSQKPLQPSGDNDAYYAFTLPNGSGCKLGSLSFFDSSGTQKASLPDVAFEGGK